MGHKSLDTPKFVSVQNLQQNFSRACGLCGQQDLDLEKIKVSNDLGPILLLLLAKCLKWTYTRIPLQKLQLGIQVC